MEPSITIDTEGSSCLASAEYFPRRATLRLGIGIYALSLYYDTDGGIAFREKRKPDFPSLQE